MRRSVVLVVLALGVVGCSDDESARDPGCEVWSDFLADTEGNASDATAAAKAREVADAAEDDEVRSFATALAARLEDGTDLGNTFVGLGEACDL